MNNEGSSVMLSDMLLASGPSPDVISGSVTEKNWTTRSVGLQPDGAAEMTASSPIEPVRQTCGSVLQLLTLKIKKKSKGIPVTGRGGL
jgi:hypothetical protein